jgi:phosphoribosylformylglycinamidine synthase I
VKSAVVVFPGSNCDRDVAVTLEQVTGRKPAMVWHRETALPSVDLIVLPGGFSYGDYLRSGAMAAHSPIVQAVKEQAKRGVAVLGICNGFQILTEAGLLPGALMRNSSLHYICRDVGLRVERADTLFTNAYTQGEQVTMPIAHKDGAYFADDETLDRIEGDGHVVLRYRGRPGTEDNGNPNGSRRSIAGVVDKTGRIMGLMPHPERASDLALGGIDGRRVFESLTRGLH